MKTIGCVKGTGLRGWNHSVCLWSRIKKLLKNHTLELVRELPQDPKVLCDFTWLVSMLFPHMVANYRSFMFLHTLM